ncbi:MAG: hypothetical protein WCX12_00470 [Candidatus Paceibacterota bacterium]|jgi:hypothetical protein
MKLKKYLIPFVFLIFLIAPINSKADLPAPFLITYYFDYKTNNSSQLIEAKQISCDDEVCVSGDTRKLSCFSGPNDRCQLESFQLWGPQKLIVTFSDKVRQSKVFNQKIISTKFSNHSQSFTVVVEDSQLIVQDFVFNNSSNSSSDLMIFIKTFLISILIEILVAFFYLSLIRTPKKLQIMVSVLIINIISLPLLWFVLLPKFSSVNYGLIISECAVVIIEALLLFLINRKIWNFWVFLLLSIAMNFFSLVLGTIIYSITF